MPVPPPVTTPGEEAFGAQRIEERPQPGPLLGRPGLAVGIGRDVLQMAVVGLDAAVAELRPVRDPAGETERILGPRDAGPPLPDVDLDQNAERSRGRCRRRERVDADLAIDDDREVADRRVRAEQPRDHRRRHDRRADQDAREAGRRHDLGLAHGRAAEADRTGLELASRDRRALVRLDVRAELAPVAADQRHHRLDIVLERPGLEQQARRREPRPRIRRADQCCVRWRCHFLIP